MCKIVDMSEISINYVTDRHYQSMCDDFFLPSLNGYDNIIKHQLDFERKNGSRGGFEFAKVMRFKIQSIIETLSKKDDKVSIWSDLDLFFAQPPDCLIKDISQRMQKFDLVISPERAKGTEINSGFFAVRSNEHTLRFFKRVLNQMKNSNRTEQPIINQILHSKNNIQWNILPRIYWNLTVGFPIPPRVMMVHVNWLPGINVKYSPAANSYANRKYEALQTLLKHAWWRQIKLL